MSQAELVREAIKSGNLAEAERLVRETLVDSHCQAAEYVVGTVIHAGHGNDALGRAALEMFLTAYELVGKYWEHMEGAKQGHLIWVHALSHFTKRLWELRLLEWVKSLYARAFRGAIEYGDGTYCERLIGDFATGSIWSDDPSEFGMTEENLPWASEMDYSLTVYARARIAAGVFASEQDYIRWQLGQTYNHYDWNSEEQLPLVAIEQVESLVNRFVELGGDASEFEGIIPRLLREHIVRLEEVLKNGKYEWPCSSRNTPQAIERTQALLATRS